MLRWLTRRLGKPNPETMAPIRSETPVYVIGDIHGRADLLEELLVQIVAEAEATGQPAETIFVGDYVDRGDASRAVLEILINLEGFPELHPIFLLGNHEQMLLEFLEDPATGPRWMRNGGLQTFMSYGVGVPGLGADAQLAEAADALRRALGPHLGFLERLQPWHRTGPLLCAHAGADPTLEPEEQDPQVCIWGCPGFPGKPREDGLWVVHGHTVVQQPLIGQGRIAIDTGAYYTGRLTALRLGPDGPTFLSAIAGVRSGSLR